jgi:hypothetical protein
LDLRFAASNPAEDDGFFKGDKNPYHDFLRRVSKAVGTMSLGFAACYRSLRYERNTWQNFTEISRQVFPDLSLGVSACYCQRSLVDESVIIIRTQVGRHNRSVMVVMYGAPCAIPPLILTPF